MMDLPVPSLWARVSVSMNVLATCLLVVGYIAVRRGRVPLHRRTMLSVLVCSVLFLAAYQYGHAQHGTTRYPFHDWSYMLYLLVLIPHSILALAILPFIVRGLWLIGHGRSEAHARLMRWVWPTWMYVSITGILVFVMLYIVPRLRM